MKNEGETKLNKGGALELNLRIRSERYLLYGRFFICKYNLPHWLIMNDT
jgi:hypothetical protein